MSPVNGIETGTMLAYSHYHTMYTFVFITEGAS